MRDQSHLKHVATLKPRDASSAKSLDLEMFFQIVGTRCSRATATAEKKQPGNQRGLIAGLGEGAPGSAPMSFGTDEGELPLHVNWTGNTIGKG